MTWRIGLVSVYVLVACAVLVLAGAFDAKPLVIEVRVRQAELPTGGSVLVHLDTDTGPLTLSGELDDGPLLKWLILHGGQTVTLTVQPKETQRAER